MLNRTTPEEGIPIKEYIRMKYGAEMAESGEGTYELLYSVGLNDIRRTTYYYLSYVLCLCLCLCLFLCLLNYSWKTR